MKDEIVKILDISPRTYYLWKKEQRPIIDLLEKYFSGKDLANFLENAEVPRLDLENRIFYSAFDSFFKFYKNLPEEVWRLMLQVLNSPHQLMKFENKETLIASIVFLYVNDCSCNQKIPSKNMIAKIIESFSNLHDSQVSLYQILEDPKSLFYTLEKSNRFHDAFEFFVIHYIRTLLATTGLRLNSEIAIAGVPKNMNKIINHVISQEFDKLQTVIMAYSAEEINKQLTVFLGVYAHLNEKLNDENLFSIYEFPKT